MTNDPNTSIDRGWRIADRYSRMDRSMKQRKRYTFSAGIVWLAFGIGFVFGMISGAVLVVPTL